MPTEDKMLRGAPGHHPRPQTVLVAGRLDDGELLPTPPHFDAEERRAFRELESLARLQIDRADAPILEAAAVALATARSARKHRHELARARGRELRRDRASRAAAIAADPDASASLPVPTPALPELLGTNSQGVVAHPLLSIEREAMRELRLLAENLPLSPIARAKLGMRAGSKGRAERSMEAELDRVLPQRARFRVVGGDDE